MERFFFLLLLISANTFALHAQKKNVLFLMADDFNFWLHKLGYYQAVETPNLDQLASKGVLFEHASCSSPVCNPSRNALWSGLRPTTTGISSNGDGFVREKPGFENIVSMHQYFMQNGYFTYGAGKLWHPGKMGSPETDPTHWSDMYTGNTGAAGGPFYQWASADNQLFKWSAGDYNPENANDTKMARYIAQLLLNYKRSEHADQPFFVGCGFFRPHLPWNCSKEFFDRFNPDSLEIPKGYLENDLDDIANTSPADIHKEIVANGQWKNAIRAYLANLTFADFNVGIVLDALDSSGLADNTIVCFMGDHGWHLGEKDRWSKYALYDMANHTTLIIYDPSAKGNGKVCKKVVSLQDLYPTLVELTGLPQKKNIEGRSIAPLLQNPEDSSWNYPILMTYAGTNIIQNNTWRYIYSEKSPQLYNLRRDPYEWHNLIDSVQYQPVVERMKMQIDSIVAIGQAIKSRLTATREIHSPEPSHKILKNTVVTDGCLSLDLTYTAPIVKLTVFDLAGRKLQENTLIGELDNVHLQLKNDLKKGMYILYIEDDEGESLERFIIS